MKKYILGTVGITFFFIASYTFGATILFPIGGGTGTSTISSGAVLYGNGTSAFLSVGPCSDNQIIKYTSNLPLCASDATGGGGSSDFNYIQGAEGHYLIATTTSVGFITGSTASSTLWQLTVGYSTTTSATSTNSFITNLVLTNASSTYLTVSDTAWINKIGGDLPVVGNVIVDSAAAGTKYLQFINSDMQIGGRNSATMNFTNNLASGNFIFAGTNNPNLIVNGGNVGIGMTTPK